MKIMNKRTTILLLTAVVLLLAATVGGTIAYLTTSTGSVVNTFEPGSVVPVIAEAFDGTEKTNVFVWNTGTVDAYIRAAVVVTWQDADGNVYSKTPVVGTDYTISIPADNRWEKGSDGYYYYTSEIKPSEEKPTGVGTQYATGYLLTGCKVAENAEVPTGYTLNVEILAQAIQTKPVQALNDANWEWHPSSGS